MLTHFHYFWPQKLSKITISGARNSENGSAIFLEPETAVMVQFLAPEIVIIGERNFMENLRNRKRIDREQTENGRTENKWAYNGWTENGQTENGRTDGQ